MLDKSFDLGVLEVCAQVGFTAKDSLRIEQTAEKNDDCGPRKEGPG